MRRWTIAEFGLVLALLASLPAESFAQPAVAPRRPQPKIVTFEPAKETSTVVGVIGQVGRPGTYQFTSAPTLDQVIAVADGMTAEASETVRLIRGGRVAHAAAYSTAAQQQLTSGDLVVIDAKPARSGNDRPAEKKFVWLAFVGVQDRPFIVPCPIAHAHPDLIVQKLGQRSEILPSVRVLPPPSAALPKTAGTPLPDGTVLFFDRSSIQVNGLPDDLPPILPCGLPEQPDIGGYGVRNAYEERLQSEPAGSRPAESPRFDPVMPFPNRDAAEPTPIPLPEEPAPTISSTKQSAGSPPVSTVPYSNGPTPINTRRHRLTGLAPTAKSTAADTQPPSWKKKLELADDELAAGESDSTTSDSGPLSLGQMLGIVSSAGLLIGLALAIRAIQQQKRLSAHRAGPSRTLQPQPATAPAIVHPVATAVVPPPHLPPQSFIATAMPRTNAASGLMDELTKRQRALSDLLNHELPIIEEPLALRPGISLGTPRIEKPILRRDDGITAVEPPVSRSASASLAASSSARHHLDAPHPRLSSGPHLRVGPEAPVERALRQLQGGRP